MIPKSSIEQIVQKQLKSLAEQSIGQARDIEDRLPYLTDRALLIGGTRGSGTSSLLYRLFHNDYPEAWFTDFDDPRMAGFDAMDFRKLEQLIEDSGKGTLLFNRIDLAADWMDFCIRKIEQGIKIISTVSLDTLYDLSKSPDSGQQNLTQRFFIPMRLYPLSYREYLRYTHKSGGAQVVNEYMLRGSFPGMLRPENAEALRRLYTEIVSRDALIAGGIRDHNTLQRVLLHLMTHTGESVTANKLRDKLRIKAVSTVAEHMSCAERAGLVHFVSILSDNPARQAVNPRKVYATDTAMAQAVSWEDIDKPRLFETLVFNHLKSAGYTLHYTNELGGCDFIATDDEGTTLCIQSCYEDDPDCVQTKTEGLVYALEATRSKRGIIVTRDRTDQIETDGYTIETMDADTFLSDF